MSKCVQLPFCVPVFATVQSSAAPGLAMENHPTAYNAMLNQCTSLTCTRKFLRGFTTPQVYIHRLGIYEFSCFERYVMCLKFSLPHIHSIVKKMLDEGFYIFYHNVDDFYMPGKSWYGTRHMYHDGVICGYDDGDKTYSIAAYDINWVYSLIRIPQDAFAKGIESALEARYYGNLLPYKINVNEVKLDTNVMLKNLKEYVCNTVDKFSLEEDGSVNGTAVHDLLIMYIDKLIDGSVPHDKMDWRALRPIWEHKRCMLDRIRAVEQKYGWDDGLSKEYEAIVELSNRARMTYAMYHKNEKKPLLEIVRRALDELKQRDMEAVNKLIQRMEEELK